MTERIVSERTQQFQKATAPFLNFFSNSSWSRRRHEPNICDFVFGNPHEMPLQGFVDALQHHAVPHNKDWFAYKDSEAASREIISQSLREWRKVPFESRDIFMTNGAFAAISVALTTLVDSGDEVIFISPPWFFYEALITGIGATPIRVKINPQTFDLDLGAIDAAITHKTRAIIINSPNNPTGKIYPTEMLQQLAQLLTTASQRIGHTIYLLSDEAYSKIVFDGRLYVSPTEFYPDSLLLYTYGKTLLTPGQRIGYIALPPTMENRHQLRDAIFMSQVMLGWAFPNALLQHALADLDKLSIDIAHLERKRERLVTALRDMGYEIHSPEGTFYLMPRSPWQDDIAFVELLAEYAVFCLPGNTFEAPGYFRISITANDQMIDRALPGFAAALEKSKTALPQR